jgi:DNA-directed RNA polymerase subunit N (RpoN/RPB10)
MSVGSLCFNCCKIVIDNYSEYQQDMFVASDYPLYVVDELVDDE